MAVATSRVEEIAARYELLKAHLNERQRRLWAGAEAKSIGHGGVHAVSSATGMSINTVRSGREELETPDPERPPALEQQRRAGAGRPTAPEAQPGLVEALDQLVEPVTRGEPTSPLRWTSKSTSKLAQELTQAGHPVSPNTVGRLLKEAGYSLQSTQKRLEGQTHPDRDAQFAYIAQTSATYLEAGWPVLSVDTKNKELVGNFKAKGVEWQPTGQPVPVQAYDFPSLAEGKAVPYGIYDIFHNEGWVSVGISADTASFAVQTLRTWYERMGQERFGRSPRLMLTADSGGSNSARSRLWKLQLQHFADETGMEITVLHYPPGTSKWNKIEHRMFNHITLNWRGRPLTSFEVIVQCIAATTTSKGLRIQAALDQTIYEKGIKVTDAQMKQLHIERHQFHGDWNYTIKPKNTST